MSLKITMIGVSGTGKSCYLYATYFRMLEGIGGFNFSCKDYNQGLDLQDAWDMMLDEGVWPAGNAESANFDFTCFYRGKSIGDFEWLDYRGGILLEHEDKENDNEVAQFLRRAETSDALLVCLPADRILSARPGEDKKQGNQWRSMAARLQQIVGGVVKRNPSAALIFLITKSDMCKKPDDGRFCVETVKKSFQQYFYGTPEHVMIAVTRMLEKTKTEETGDAQETVKFEQREKIVGTVEPYNVHLPILFPFYLHTVAAAQEFEAKARSARGEERDFSRRASSERAKSWWGKFWTGQYSQYYDDRA
ncbi:MAG: hypothetical protein IJE77_01220, partial [Thermoguttaceae bacterium]|nr:hypothetical protein [Thermoguttaceae bacterium]